jgi:SsrA-binding protein
MEPVINKKARFNYFIEDTFQAGIMLEGWELKPILDRKINLDNSHIIIDKGELYLFNALITPLVTTSTHVPHVQDRRRKLLMKKQEIMRLIGKIVEKGYTIVPTKVYRKGRFIKVEIALAKGKKLHDKRETEKQADWKREQEKLMKNKT